LATPSGGPLVPVGTKIHDKVYVSNAPGTPASVPSPSGSVVFHLFGQLDCSGPEIKPAETVKLVPSSTPGQSSAESSPIPMPASVVCYRADYAGKKGEAEPVRVALAPLPLISIAKCPAVHQPDGTWKTVNAGGAKVSDCAKAPESTPPWDQQTDMTQAGTGGGQAGPKASPADCLLS